MGRTPVEHKSARFGNVDVVVAQQFELIEHQQKAGGISARVDAIKLPDIIRVLHSGAGHVIFRASNRIRNPLQPLQTTVRQPKDH